MTIPVASVDVAEPFATRLRAQTQAAHTRAESAGFMSNLMGGSGSVDDYAALLAALASDLEYFEGDSWRDRIVALPATERYVARLESVAASSSASFVAHHYLRYLGDLSGGQIIRVMVQRHYAIPDEGLSFLVFPLIPKPKPFKDLYRAALEDAAWTPDERDGFVDEVDVAYGLNYDLFTELGQRAR
jgi:heme oxygenase